MADHVPTDTKVSEYQPDWSAFITQAARLKDDVAHSHTIIVDTSASPAIENRSACWPSKNITIPDAVSVATATRPPPLNGRGDCAKVAPVAGNAAVSTTKTWFWLPPEIRATRLPTQAIRGEAIALPNLYVILSPSVMLLLLKTSTLPSLPPATTKRPPQVEAPTSRRDALILKIGWPRRLFGFTDHIST